MPTRWARLLLIAVTISACGSLPEPKYKKFDFPVDHAYLDSPPSTRTYRILGLVRTRVDYPGMIQDKSDEQLCQNYFNKGARELLLKAKDQMKASAVINIRSVVFYMNGKKELHRDPQCSEDEAGGQILLQGQAVRYVIPKNRMGPKKKAAPVK